MPIETLENALAIVFLLVCAVCLYWSFVPALPMQFSSVGSDLSQSDAVRLHRAYVIRMVLGILFMVSLLPMLLNSRDRAFASMFNNPREWVSKELPAERQYASFIRRFQELDAIVVSWPGCHVDDDRLARLSEELTHPPDQERRRMCAQFFARVITGYDTVRELMAPPLLLTRDQAVARLVGSLVGFDKNTSCAVVFLGEEGVVRRGEAIQLLRDIVHEVCQLSESDFILAGAPVDGMMIDRNSISSADLYALPSNIMVLILCRLCLRKWRLTFVVFGVAIVGQLLAVALVDWCGFKMNAILIVMSPLTLVLTVSAGVHLVNYYYDEVRLFGHANAVRGAFAKAWLPCVIATTTTVLGLLSLLVSDSLPIALFAVFSSICITTSVGLLFLILPGVMAIWPVQVGRSGSSGRISGVSQRVPAILADFVCRFRHCIVIVCLLVMGIGVCGLSKLDTTVNVRVMFANDSPILRNYSWLEENLGPTVPVEIILRFHKEDNLQPLERLRLVGEVHEAVEDMDCVGGVISASTFSPKLPADSELLTTQPSVPLSEFAEFRDRMRELPYVRQCGDVQHWRIHARVPALGEIDYGAFLDRLAAHVEPVLAATREHLPECSISASYTGAMPVTYAAQRALLDDLIDSFVTALAFITFVMMLYLGSIRAGLLVMLPNVFPTILLFGFTSLRGVPIDIGSVMTASVALGIAVDDTLHFVTWYRREYGRSHNARDAVCSSYNHCGWAMIQSTLICGLGMLVYTLSPFVPARQFAFMMITLLAAALVGDLLLLPALLAGPLERWLRPAAVGSNRAGYAHPRPEASGIGIT